jgi:hypothetical protein
MQQQKVSSVNTLGIWVRVDGVNVRFPGGEAELLSTVLNHRSLEGTEIGITVETLQAGAVIEIRLAYG